MKRAALLAIALGAATCSYPIYESVRGEFPLDIRVIDGRLRILTASIGGEGDRNRLTVYDLKNTAITETASFPLAAVPPDAIADVSAQMVTGANAQVEVWGTASFTGGYQVFRQGAAIEAWRVPDDLAHGWGQIVPAVRVTEFAQSTWLWAEQTANRDRSADETLVVAGGAVSVAPGAVMYAGCSEGRCLMIDQQDDLLWITPLDERGKALGEPTLTTLPYWAPAYNWEAAYPPSALRAHCGPSAESAHRMYFSNAWVDYAARSTDAPVVKRLSSNVEALWSEPGILVCGNDPLRDPVLWFGYDRKLWMVDATAATVRQIDDTFGARASGEPLRSLRLVGSADAEGWWIVYSYVTGTKHRYECKDPIFGDTCDHYIHSVRSEAVRITRKGVVAERRPL